MNYFRLYPLQIHYKLTVLKTFPYINLKIYPPSSHFTTHIREHSTVKAPRDKMRGILPNYSCKLTKCKIVHYVTCMQDASRLELLKTQYDVSRRQLTLMNLRLIYFHMRKLTLGIALSNSYGRRQTPYRDRLAHLCSTVAAMSHLPHLILLCIGFS